MTSLMDRTYTVDSPDFFGEADENYRLAKEAYYEARDDAIQAAAEADAMSCRMKDAEAEAIVNGYANGGNEQQRVAALRVYLAKAEEAAAYRKAADELRTAQRRKALADNAADEAANEMSRQKRRMEAHIANVNRAAAIEANAGLNERN